eukprot:GEMP01020970.1.p1 GENE.GEMP01020970.1~~GEMP01020970.1.p1  ORF type:complete len:399 (+),score=78.05 GEMP01020970.1:146-1342(+)
MNGPLQLPLQSTHGTCLQQMAQGPVMQPNGSPAAIARVQQPAVAQQQWMPRGRPQIAHGMNLMLPQVMRSLSDQLQPMHGQTMVRTYSRHGQYPDTPGTTKSCEFRRPESSTDLGSVHSPPRSPGGRKDSWSRGQVMQEKLSTSLNIMVELDTHVATLERESALLKAKLIETKRNELAKYFTSSGKCVLTLALQTWKRMMDDCKYMRTIEDLQLQMEHDRLKADMTRAQYENDKAQLLDQFRQIPALQEELREAKGLIASLGNVFSACARQCQKYPDPQPNVIQAPDTLTKLKDAMHKTLKEIDPRYLPPLNTPSVLEISQKISQEFVERAGQLTPRICGRNNGSLMHSRMSPARGTIHDATRMSSSPLTASGTFRQVAVPSNMSPVSCPPFPRMNSQ